jgi:hypothetical protein
VDDLFPQPLQELHYSCTQWEGRLNRVSQSRCRVTIVLTLLIWGKSTPRALNSSYDRSNSAISSGVHRCCHLDVSLINSSLFQTVGPVISLGKAEYGANNSGTGSCCPEVKFEVLRGTVSVRVNVMVMLDSVSHLGCFIYSYTYVLKQA